MQRFLIPFLIPLESSPRKSSLDFLISLWKSKKSFEYLEKPPAVSCIDGNFYLEDGNNRAVLFWLNRIEFIDAEVVKFSEEEIDGARRTNEIAYHENLRVKVYSPVDLAAKIKEPEKYQLKL